MNKKLKKEEKNFNLIFITQEDPFYLPNFFKDFLNNFSIDGVKIKGIIILKTLNKKSLYKLAKQMYNFYGLKDFIKMGINYSYKKIMNFLYIKKIKSSKEGNFYSIRHIAKAYGIKVMYINNVNSYNFLENLRKMKIDLIISVAASQKFYNELLNLPTWGCINIHSSPLPKYRGMMPNFWVLYNKEKETAVTIFKMNENLDDGEIILQEKVKIVSNETLGSLVIKTKELSVKMLIEVTRRIKEGTIVLKPNDRSKASYYSFPTKEQARKFRMMGKKLL